MTARTEWHGVQFLSGVEHGVVQKLDRIGARGKAVTQAHTPVVSGRLKRSEYHVVVDKDGSVLAGDTTDGNGNAVPSLPGTGKLRVVVGTNEAAANDGQSYALWVEVGVEGKPGHGMLAAGNAAMRAAAKEELRGILP